MANTGGCVRPEVAGPPARVRASVCHTSGPGKYVSLGRWKTMCGIIPSGHCPCASCSSSVSARSQSQVANPIATKAESQFHWNG
jgi:hypothetical protein